MVNWYAVGLSVALLYMVPKRLIASKLLNYYRCRRIKLPQKIVIVILDDVGMNYEKARRHAKNRAKLIIGSQDHNKAETIKNELTQTTKNKSIITMSVNRNDRNSIKTFAQDIIKSETAIDVLINNEGFDLSGLDIVFKKQDLAKERFENHCLNFLFEDGNVRNYKLPGWYQSLVIDKNV